jgi:lysophospholipase L1-like esterase
MNGIFSLGHVTKLTNYWRVFLALVLAMTFVGFATAGVANADATTSPAFYLAIGGSESVGVQPTAADPHGQRTGNGYADDVVIAEASQGVTLDLHEIGCPDETTQSMLNGVDGCYSPPDSQLIEALAFLQSHQGERGIVTIDLGFNDVRHCLADLGTFTSCVNQSLTVVHTQLTSIVASLMAAAGPGVDFVGLNHDDPYLAVARNSNNGSKVARDSLAMVEELNRTLHDVYSSFDIPVADVASEFAVGGDHSAKLLKAGSLNEGSLVACELTWMCAPAPYGPNVHPNDAGYLAIADAIEDVLPPLS